MRLRQDEANLDLRHPAANVLNCFGKFFKIFSCRATFVLISLTQRVRQLININTQRQTWSIAIGQIGIADLPKTEASYRRHEGRNHAHYKKLIRLNSTRRPDETHATRRCRPIRRSCGTTLWNVDTDRSPFSNAGHDVNSAQKQRNSKQSSQHARAVST